MQFKSIGLIGYGEVGKIFSAGLKAPSCVSSMNAWDLKFVNAASSAAELAHAAQAGRAGLPVDASVVCRQ